MYGMDSVLNLVIHIKKLKHKLLYSLLWEIMIIVFLMKRHNLNIIYFNNKIQAEDNNLVI